MRTRRGWPAAVTVAVLLAAGCTTAAPERPATASAPTTAGSPAPTTAVSPATPTARATGESPTTSVPTTAAPRRTATPPPHPVSLPALAERTFVGRDLRVRRVLARTGAYTRYAITYESGRLTISGIMNVPRGGGPFPVVVLNHGYIDPAVYVSGQGLARVQDYLARSGYVALHIDYRNHAGSDNDPRADLDLRLAYAEDAINAVKAVKASRLPYLDGDRVAYLGRSMGGGVTLNALVAQPGLVDAAVVYASVSSDAVDNFNRWIRNGRPELAQAIIRRYGSPERNPAFWRNASAYPFFDRIREPILMHHGTADDTCPIAWARRTASLLRAEGKDVRLVTYPGEGHQFGAAYLPAIRRTVAFLDTHLRA